MIYIIIGLIGAIIMFSGDMILYYTPTSQPLGVSSYELSKLIPEEFKGSMPTIEEIEAELNE